MKGRKEMMPSITKEKNGSVTFSSVSYPASATMHKEKTAVKRPSESDAERVPRLGWSPTSLACARRMVADPRKPPSSALSLSYGDSNNHRRAGNFSQPLRISCITIADYHPLLIDG